MDKVEVTEADRLCAADILDEISSLTQDDGIGQVADLIRDGEYDEHDAVERAARHRITTEAATRAKVEGEIVAWLLKDDTRLRYEESAPEAEREHFSWWAADAITQGTYK